jgi:hypothetical protein
VAIFVWPMVHGDDPDGLAVFLSGLLLLPIGGLHVLDIDDAAWDWGRRAYFGRIPVDRRRTWGRRFGAIWLAMAFVWAMFGVILAVHQASRT